MRGNSLTRSFKEEVALDHQPVLHPDEEERRTVDLEAIQAYGERDARAQPTSALGEADGDLDRDALPVELHRAGQDDPPGASRGSFIPAAVPLTEQYGCSFFLMIRRMPSSTLFPHP